MPGVSEAEQTRRLGAAGIERIRRAPVEFVRLMAMNYQSLWTIDRLHHPDRAARLTAFVAAHRPLPFERQAFSLEPDQVFEFQPSPRVRDVQAVFTTVEFWTGVFALVGLVGVATWRQLPPPLAVAATAALAAHGCLLLTATLAAGLSRFTLGLWPAIVVAAMFGLWSILPARVTAR
jgi:hypothetical protein